MDLSLDLLFLAVLIILAVFLKSTTVHLRKKRDQLTEVCLDKKSGESKSVITIGVAAKSEWGFSGYSLKFAFQKVNLFFSNNWVFQRLDMNQNVCFTVVSMSEPGTFLANDVALTPIPGVFLFMLVPMDSDPVAVFDDMLATARQLNYQLDGVLCDAEMHPLSEDNILALRAQVKKYAQKKQYAS